MSRRRRGQLSYRQMLAIAAILLALLALTGLGGIPWLPIAVIVLALTDYTQSYLEKKKHSKQCY